MMTFDAVCFGEDETLSECLTRVLVEMKELQLEECFGLQDSDLMTIYDTMPNLQTLQVKNCDSFTPESVMRIGKLKNLTALDIYGPPIANLGTLFPVGICLENLKTFTPSWYLDEAQLASISLLMPKLETFMIYKATFSLQAFRCLLDLKHLKNLFLEQCERTGSLDGLLLGKRQFESLVFFRVLRCDLGEDAFVYKLVEKLMPNIENDQIIGRYDQILRNNR